MVTHETSAKKNAFMGSGKCESIWIYDIIELLILWCNNGIMISFVKSLSFRDRYWNGYRWNYMTSEVSSKIIPGRRGRGEWDTAEAEESDLELTNVVAEPWILGRQGEVGGGGWYLSHSQNFRVRFKFSTRGKKEWELQANNWLILEVFSSKKNASVFSGHKTFICKIQDMSICICQSHY